MALQRTENSEELEVHIESNTSSVIKLKDVKSQSEWEMFFQHSIQLKADQATEYAQSFTNNEILGETVYELIENETMILLLAMSPSHYLKLLAHIKGVRVKEGQRPNSHLTQKNVAKLPLPRIACNSSQRDFDVFNFNWSMYRSHFKLSQDDAVRTLYLCCPEEIQDRIIAQLGTQSADWNENVLMETIKDVVTTKLSPIVHIKKFHAMQQKEGEGCNEFLQRLRSAASSCHFCCPHCHKDIAQEHVKHKFVLGLKNKEIQTCALKTESITPGTPLTQLLNEVLTIEQSTRDHGSINKDEKNLI